MWPGQGAAFCLQHGFRLRTLTCFYGLSDGKGAGKGAQEVGNPRARQAREGRASQPWQRSKGCSRDKAAHCGRGLVLTSNLKPRRGPHSLPRGARCIYLEQSRPKPCIHNGSASLTDAHRTHSTEAVSWGLAVKADGIVSVLQGETKNDAQTKAKTKHTGDRYLRQ